MSSRCKISAYFTIVWPLLEYMACMYMGSSSRISDFMRLRKYKDELQLSDYNHYSSVTKMSWMANTGKWKVYLFSRLTQLYKIRRHHIPAINLQPYYLQCTNTISNKTPPPASLYITI